MTTIEAPPRPIQPSRHVGSVLWTPNGGPQLNPDIIKEFIGCALTMSGRVRAYTRCMRGYSQDR